jgi:hypothetical protein
MSFDKSVLGAMYALRECLRGHLSAAMLERQGESQAVFGAGYVLPVAPDADSITLECNAPTNVMAYPWVMVSFIQQSWDNTPTAAQEADSTSQFLVKWWFSHDGSGGGSKLGAPEVAIAMDLDIRNSIIRCLRDTTNGVTAAYNSDVSNILEAPVGIPAPRVAANSAGLYNLKASICLEVKHKAVVV